MSLADISLVDEWRRFFFTLRSTIVIALMLFAVVTVIMTWWRTKAIGPTVTVLVIGAVAVWAAANAGFVHQLMNEERWKALHQDQELKDPSLNS